MLKKDKSDSSNHERFYLNSLETKEKRKTWDNEIQFVLACIGACVGLGNFWRFPYLCYKSGGGAFLIPYFIMLFICGIPLLLMELSVGQFTRRGPVEAIGRLCPLLKGAGVGTVVISFFLSTYYNVIIAWAIFYFSQSLRNFLPWSCYANSTLDGCINGTTVGNESLSQEYYNEVVLSKSSGMEEFGSIRLDLLVALIIAWSLVYFSIWKSVRSTGKVVYFTATLPYVLIGAFLWRALTLPGSQKGLDYLFKPKWKLLLNAEVWVNAAAQNFNSIGIAFGSLIAFSSYNKYDNNIIYDTWIVSITNSCTSLMAGIIVFATLGHIAEEQGKDIDEVVDQGPGLAFVVYPEALAKMPWSSLWSALFFLMIIFLGLDSQFANVEVVVTSLRDSFPSFYKNCFKHHEILVLVVCAVTLACGLPNIFQGGIYYFQLIDYFSSGISLMYLAFFEVVAILWFYGGRRLAGNVKSMIGRKPSPYFLICWYVASPVLILAIWIFSWVDYKEPTYNNGEYVYPSWAIMLGWLITSCSLLPIPVYAVIAVWNAEGSTLRKRIINATKPQVKEGKNIVELPPEFVKDAYFNFNPNANY